MKSTFVKIVVTVPVSDADELRLAIGEVGGGKIGNYKNCSFSSLGIGRFIPTESANPAIGAVGKSEEVSEERIEITAKRDSLQAIVKIIRDRHPYEEVVLDIYPLEDIDF